MNGRYSIRREREAPAVPFGATGIAALCAGLAGIVGLIVPMALIESLSFQLYLDTITDLARPPLGTTARLLAAAALALIGGGLGYALARWLGVRSAAGGLDALLARLRGNSADDEEDAPPLRSADRHPDAPARRPFSAARDIPVAEEAWPAQDEPMRRYAPMSFADDDEELLLEMPLASDGQPPAAAADGLPEPLLSSIVTDAEASVDETEHDDIDSFHLVPPSLDDWELPSAPDAGLDDEPATPVASDDADDRGPVVVAAPVEPRSFARRDTAPLDLSAARLDDLIARLEAGLSRRSVAQPPDASGERGSDTGGASPLTEQPVDDDPAFPHDPALAAALATLRKMNQRG